jgi:cell division protein FtsI (penicillin-binding protein 3)
MKPLAPSLPSFQWLAERVWSVEHAFERARASRPEEDTRRRISFVRAGFAIVFLLLIAGAVRAALFRHLADDGSSGLPAVASRADLVDRNGQLIATDLVHYGLYVDPDEVWNADETRRALLAAAPALNPERLGKALKADHQSYLLGGLTPQERDRIHALGLPGVSFAEEDKRVYPLGVSAAHLIGFADSGGRGIAGVERALEGQVLADGKSGAPVALSIDLRVQSALEDELDKAATQLEAKGGAAIVTDVKTGEILGLASWPSYDPSAPGRASDDAKLNRAATSVYEMGSTFKVFTLSAGLDSHIATINTTFDAREPLRIGSRLIHDDEAQNRVMTLADVFIRSSNIGTAKLGLKMGADTLARYFDAFGLLRAAPIELRESARPIARGPWDENTVASRSFGHAISVTPLQVAAGVGAVANGGVYVPLTIRKRVRGQPIEGERRVISAETSQEMLGLMRLNVEKGTGTKANISGLRVGGKTGSANKIVGGRYDGSHVVASFASVFPTDGGPSAQRYLVLVLLDDPKANAFSSGQRTAAWTAAPAAGRVIQRIAPFLGVRPIVDPVGAALADTQPVAETSSGAEQ